MNKNLFKFLPERWITESKEPLIGLIYPGLLEPIKCNVLDDNREFTDIELNRIAEALMSDEDVRWEVDTALITAMAKAVDPNEDWSETDKEFLSRQPLKNE